MKVRDVLRRLIDDGWIQAGQKGSHRHFTHRSKPGKVTVNGHPSDDVPIFVLRSIFRQAGLDWEQQQ